MWFHLSFSFSSANGQHYLNVSSVPDPGICKGRIWPVWQENTICPGSSGPFYVVSYYINGSLLPGHTVHHSDTQHPRQRQCGKYCERVNQRVLPGQQDVGGSPGFEGEKVLSRPCATTVIWEYRGIYHERYFEGVGGEKVVYQEKIK